MKIILLFLLIISVQYGQSKLRQIYLESKTERYMPLTPRDFEMATTLFKALLKTNISSKIQTQYLETLGLILFQVNQNNTVIIDTKKRGWGFYIIRHSHEARSLLSIPHRFYDLGTANIGYKLMKEYPYKAIAFNTVHRKVMDTAHTEYTLFNAFHLAFSLIYPKEYIYQLHGFSSKNHTIVAAKSTDAIVSTTTFPTIEADNIVQCINELGYNSRLFGKNVFELGGTTNLQAKLLRKKKYQNFIHIELNKQFRDDLYKDSALRKKIKRCLP